MEQSVRQKVSESDKLFFRIIDNFVMMETKSQCMQTFFKTPILVEILTDSKSTSGGMLYICGDHTFVSNSWACKKQPAVPHSSTEAEVITFDTGLRMVGLLALKLWDRVFDVLDPPVFRAGATLRVDSKPKTHQIRQESIDHVPPQTHNSSATVLRCFLYEDKEVVINMLIKGRSPHMRHVSRAHRKNQFEFKHFCEILYRRHME